MHAGRAEKAVCIDIESVLSWQWLFTKCVKADFLLY